MKRKHFQIRNLIISSIEKYPKPAFEISGDTGLALSTVKKHLLYLQSLGTVTTGDFKRKDKLSLWMLRNK